MDVKIKAELYIHVGEKYFWNTHKKSFWKYLHNYLENRSLKNVSTSVNIRHEFATS